MEIGQLLRRKGHDVATIEGSRSVRDALTVLAERGIGALVVSADGRARAARTSSSPTSPG